MAEQVVIEDGQERILTEEQAECLGAQKLICRCPPCGPNIWHFKDEATTFEEVDHVLSVLDGRARANASGQSGEDVESICAAHRASNAGVALPLKGQPE